MVTEGDKHAGRDLPIGLSFFPTARHFEGFTAAQFVLEDQCKILVQSLTAFFHERDEIMLKWWPEHIQVLFQLDEEINSEGGKKHSIRQF